MKPFLIAAAVLVATPAFAADVGTLGGLGEPGYGQLEIHRNAKPQLVFPEPVIVQQADGGSAVESVYLHVPVDHAKDWKKYCSQYDACGKRVYFVDDGWYNKVYLPEKKRSGKP